jgi:predicted amidohydrolase YtcJ
MSIPDEDGVDVGGCVEIGGFVDHHTHLLKDAGGVGFPWQGGTVRAFHERVARDGSTPMDVGEPSPGDQPPDEQPPDEQPPDEQPPDEQPPAVQPAAVLADRLYQALTAAAGTGLVEITEMGMRNWWYLDALDSLQQAGPLPVRVRVYLASGLAEQAGTAELSARRAAGGPWVRLAGIKFYADGWLVPRTCALCADFADQPDAGILFADTATLARRAAPFAERDWRIATHAIGDRGIETVLDAYELIWGRDPTAIAAAAPRIEHGSIQSAELVARCAELGVGVCIQPSFPVTDAAQIPAALGTEREPQAYPWAALAEAGVPLLLGTDYPIEVIEPLVGLARLVTGRSDRPGFATEGTAPEHSRLPLDMALALATDESAGTTRLSADPAAAGPAGLDRIEVAGSASATPFSGR